MNNARAFLVVEKVYTCGAGSLPIAGEIIIVTGKLEAPACGSCSDGCLLMLGHGFTQDSHVQSALRYGKLKEL